MLLALNVGNSNITLGAYADEGLLARWRMATERATTADEYAALLSSLLAQKGWSFADFADAILCSVVPPLTATFEELIVAQLDRRPMIVSHRLRTGLRLLYEQPQQLGADRLADAVAGRHLYGTPVIVIDFGTATTFNVVSAQDEFLGGVIVPGIGISVDALFEHAAALPRIELILPERAVGTNTIQSMQSGVLYGYIGLVEGLIRRLRRELGVEARVVATGGFARQVAPHVPAIELVNPDLTLEGLRILYLMNDDDRRSLR